MQLTLPTRLLVITTERLLPIATKPVNSPALRRSNLSVAAGISVAHLFSDDGEVTDNPDWLGLPDVLVRRGRYEQSCRGHKRIARVDSATPATRGRAATRHRLALAEVATIRAQRAGRADPWDVARQQASDQWRGRRGVLRERPGRTIPALRIPPRRPRH